MVSLIDLGLTGGFPGCVAHIEAFKPTDNDVKGKAQVADLHVAALHRPNVGTWLVSGLVVVADVGTGVVGRT